MPKASVGRVIAAVVAGWIANAILTGATELLLWTSMRSPGGQHHPDKYYVIDLICQCGYTVFGGYLCCMIASPARRAALLGMICLGLAVGGLSMPSSWPREPHWYRIILLLEWAPCVWIGWRLRSHRAVATAPAGSAV